MNLTLKQLRAFVSVAQHGSFARAAKHLSLSQPALSMVIRQLEAALGVTLFDRTTRRVTLTSNGADFLPTVERLLNDFDLAISDIRAIGDLRRGRIGVAALYSVATVLLPAVVREFASAYPAINIHLRDDNSSGVQRRVRRNEVDFGFGSKNDNDPELDYQPLFRDRLCLIGRSDHPLIRRRRPVCWKGLEGHDFLALASDTGVQPAILRVPDLPSNITAPRFEVSNTPTLEAMLLEGLGFTVMPMLAVPHLHQSGLRSRPIFEPEATREVHLLTRKGRSLSPAAQSMKTLALKHIQGVARQFNLILCES